MHTVSPDFSHSCEICTQNVIELAKHFLDNSLLFNPAKNLCALSSPGLVDETHLAPLPKEERRIRSTCSPDMIGYRQRWLQENRTWLYLSCLSPLYLDGPGECECTVLTSPCIWAYMLTCFIEHKVIGWS